MQTLFQVYSIVIQGHAHSLKKIFVDKIPRLVNMKISYHFYTTHPGNRFWCLESEQTQTNWNCFSHSQPLTENDLFHCWFDHWWSDEQQFNSFCKILAIVRRQYNTSHDSLDNALVTNIERPLWKPIQLDTVAQNCNHGAFCGDWEMETGQIEKSLAWLVYQTQWKTRYCISNTVVVKDRCLVMSSFFINLQKQI